MRDLFRLIGWTVVDLFRSRAVLEAEIWALRQQINVLRRTAPKRVSFSVFDRLVFAGLYRLFPNICDALAIVKPDTIVRWHRDCSLASRGFPVVLALEVETPWWPADGTARTTPAYPRAWHRTSPMGRAAQPRRASPARHRPTPDHR